MHINQVLMNWGIHTHCGWYHECTWMDQVPENIPPRGEKGTIEEACIEMDALLVLTGRAIKNWIGVLSIAIGYDIAQKVVRSEHSIRYDKADNNLREALMSHYSTILQNA